MIWRSSNKGHFTVKYPYHLEVEIINRKNGEISNGNTELNYWKMTWKLNVPGFVKHFTWKACNDLLPTKVNLYKRMVIQNSVCPICLRDDENTIHALWSCLVASDIWGAGVNPLRKWTSNMPSLWILWKKMVKNFNITTLEMTVITLRQIWTRRNKLVFVEKFDSPWNILTKAWVLMENYHQAQQHPKNPNQINLQRD